ncbi:hypothetical protein ACQUW5_12335 [Legionella sp. CNM-1927-20]|uniref:hypothetical protein n=1 Tax=Legionella sp. CNM-1927-20 TaxID=3422221 RepID=UPI00403AF080
MSLVEQKVKNALQNLIDYLEQNSVQHGDDVDQVRQKIHLIISDELKELEEEEQQSFYKKLSIHLHSDKIKANKKLSSLLSANNISLDEPFQILGAVYKKPNVIDDLANDPVTATAKLVINFIEQAYHHLKLYKRYYEPLRTLVGLTSWLINIGLIIVGIGAIIVTTAIASTISLINKIQNNLIDSITRGELNQASQDLVREPSRYQEAENKFYKGKQDLEIAFLKGKLIKAVFQTDRDQINSSLTQLRQMPLEDFKQYYIASQAALLNETEEQIKTKFADEVKTKILQEQTTGFNKIKFITQLFSHTIFGPLPAGIGNKLFSATIQRPVVALLAPVFIISTAAIELAKKLNALLMLSTLVALAGIKFVTLIAVNSPLYLLDAARYAGSKFTNLKTNKSKAAYDHTAANEENLSSSYNVMFDNNKPTQQNKETLDQNPFTHSKGGLKLFDKMRTANNDNLLLTFPTPGANPSGTNS